MLWSRGGVHPHPHQRLAVKRSPLGGNRPGAGRYLQRPGSAVCYFESKAVEIFIVKIFPRFVRGAAFVANFPGGVRSVSSPQRTHRPEQKPGDRYFAAWDSWAEGGSSEENRTEAVARMKLWLNQNGRSGSLDLMGLNLTSLPELPPGLQALEADDNSLASLPELPPGLEYLNASNNSLASLPTLPPVSTNLRVYGNRLTSLPENILTLGQSCRIDIDASHLSEAVRNRLAAAMNMPGYRGPRISFGMGGPGRLQVGSLQNEVSAWAKEAGWQPSVGWSSFRSEIHEGQFAQFLARLRETSEYKSPGTASNFQARVVDVLGQLEGDPELRGRCFNLASDAVDTCGDRVALRMLDMEVACKESRMKNDISAGVFDQKPQAVVDGLRELYRQTVISRAASEKIKALNFVDEVEVMLGFLVAFSPEFKFAAQMDCMLYPSCSNIRPEDVVATRKQLTNRPVDATAKALYRPFFERAGHVDGFNDVQNYRKSSGEAVRANQDFLQFMGGSSEMSLYLKRVFGVSLEGVIKTEVEHRQEEFHNRLESLNPEADGYGQACKDLKVDFFNIDKVVSAEKTKSLLERLHVEHGVRFDLD